MARVNHSPARNKKTTTALPTMRTEPGREITQQGHTIQFDDSDFNVKTPGSRLLGQ